MLESKKKVRSKYFGNSQRVHNFDSQDTKSGDKVRLKRSSSMELADSMCKKIKYPTEDLEVILPSRDVAARKEAGLHCRPTPSSENLFQELRPETVLMTWTFLNTFGYVITCLQTTRLTADKSAFTARSFPIGRLRCCTELHLFGCSFSLDRGDRIYDVKRLDLRCQSWRSICPDAIFRSNTSPAGVTKSGLDTRLDTAIFDL